MFKKEIEISNKKLIIETGLMAKQANGSVVLRYGDTVLLVTATANLKKQTNLNYFPLSVDYREKMYSAGKIPGGFFKREGRPGEHEIIASRLTDRPVRPLFPKDFMYEVQILINVLSYDGENIPDVLGTIGASAALAISDIPWDGPIATVRVGRIDDKYVLNPTNTELENSDMEVILSGTSDSILMVEGESDFISEDAFLSAIQYGHEAIKDIIEIQNKLVKECGKNKSDYVKKEIDKDIESDVLAFIKKDVKKFNKPKNKKERYSEIDNYVNKVWEHFEAKYEEEESTVKGIVHDAISDDLREITLKGKRADGRKHNDIRDINIKTNLLPRTHGSALFTRGETQALVTTTLGGKRDEQMLDNVDGLSYKNFMLHYNFPPFSVGEVGRMFSTSRREIGHGNLAERSLKRVLPSEEDFPYTYRIVSEILESNGSSSMATVCGGSLAMMDAGVPIKDHVAGIAMGLIMEDENKYAILSDILGTEDHIGDMDFKVAGSEKGITAIQMDLKIKGLPINIMKEALEQAREGRVHIINVMKKSLKSHNDELSEFAPKIITSSLPVDRIGEFIGPGGKNIKGLSEEYECEVNIEDDGRVTILGVDSSSMNKVKDIVDAYNLVPNIGDTYDGKVVKIMDFGAFVAIAPGKEGLVHISELAWKHVKNVEDVLKTGDEIKVKLINIDDMKRLKFSVKALLDKPDDYKEPERKPFNKNKKDFKKFSKRKA